MHLHYKRLHAGERIFLEQKFLTVTPLASKNKNWDISFLMLLEKTWLKRFTHDGQFSYTHHICMHDMLSRVATQSDWTTTAPLCFNRCSVNDSSIHLEMKFLANLSAKPSSDCRFNPAWLGHVQFFKNLNISTSLETNLNKCCATIVLGPPSYMHRGTSTWWSKFCSWIKLRICGKFQKVHCDDISTTLVLQHEITSAPKGNSMRNSSR